jgi:signal transduction histidine kinase
MGYGEPMGSAEPGRLAEEQAALRRVATLVAGGASSAEVFETVAREVAQVLHISNTAVCRYDDEGATMTVLAAWGERPDGFAPGSRWPLDGSSMSAEVLRTGRPARVEDYRELSGALAAEAREHGFSRVAGAPIVVEGRVWGVISTSSGDAPLPDHLEDRLAEFTELVATAIANSEAHDELTRLADEQAALRRVATLVAEGATPAEVFEAVSVEVARLVPADGAALTRYETDGTVTVLGGWTIGRGYVYQGKRFAVDGTVSGLILETGRPERLSRYEEAPTPALFAAREMGWRSSVGAPITVEGRLWGVLAVSSNSDAQLPSETEGRLAEFTELVATAIANAESREELTRLAEEQAALLRVATLVAERARPEEVFAAVGAEVSRLLGVPIAVMLRYDTDGMATVLATVGSKRHEVGSRWPLDGLSLARTVFETGRAATMDDYAQPEGALAQVARKAGIRWAVGVPIIVDGALWGVMNAGSRDPEPLVGDVEVRLSKFTQLLATAIANAEGRAELDASRARIVDTADATRRRIERDLHDGAQQRLVALALELRAAQAAVPSELGQLGAELSSVIDGLTGVLDGLREIALGIHPAVLAEGGLGPGLKMLARRSPVPVELEVRTERRLPEPVEVAAYYVVSEALTNAAKYASASTVRVEVDADDGRLHVAVRDDGRGGADPEHGSGLLGLKDRVEAIGGAISLDSPDGAGTSLRVELPIDADDT